MNSNKDYFKKLGKKISEPVPFSVDEKVLVQIPKQPYSIKWIFAPVTMACIVLFLFLNFQTKEDYFSENMLAVVEMLEENEFIEDLDYHMELSEIDIMSLSDEEWELLLEGEREDV